jgi:DNA segregation ATPase FtsK/SpoIIIE-like protein
MIRQLDALMDQQYKTMDDSQLRDLADFQLSILNHALSCKNNT